MIVWHQGVGQVAQSAPTPRFGTQGVGASLPVQVLVGPGNVTGAPSIDITRVVDIDSLRVEETGTLEAATLDMTIKDHALLLRLMRGEWKVLVQHLGEPVFRGFVREPEPEVVVRWPMINCSAVDVGTLMDRSIVTSSVTRKAGESDKARLMWLFDAFGSSLANEGLTRWAGVQVLNDNMPKQTFPTRLTLRQAIERILGAASDSADYYLDYRPSLVTWDDDHPLSEEAPWDVNLDPAPSSTQLAPEQFRFRWDSTGRRSGYYVQGANAVGSGYVTDRSLGMRGPWSADLYGRSDDYLSAPDADTQTKRDRVAKATLRDTRNPVPSGSATFTGEDRVVNGSGKRWRAGQLVYVTSAMHGLNGRLTDPGPWAGKDGGLALQPFRITRATTTWLAGGTQRSVEVEFGWRRIRPL